MMASSLTVQVQHITSILETLEKIVLPGFGPNSLNTMLNTSTGQLMVTSDSSCILKSINLSHPFGRMIVKSIQRQLAITGNGGKTFLLILAQIFREIENRNSTTSMLNWQQERTLLTKGFTELKREIPMLMETLLRSCCHFNLKPEEALEQEIGTMVSTMLQGRFPIKTVQHISDMIISLIFNDLPCQTDLENILSDCLQNFEFMCLEAVGYPVNQSRILKGFVVQRDFHIIQKSLFSLDQSVVKFIIMSCSLSGDQETDDKAIYPVHNKQSFDDALLYRSKVAGRITKLLETQGVQLVISTEKLNLMETNALHLAKLSAVQMADEEEIIRLSDLLGISVVYSLSEIMMEPLQFIGEVSKCETIIVSGRKYVHLATESTFPQNKYQKMMIAKQILITGHSRGTCYQVRTALKNCLQSLFHWTRNKLYATSNSQCLQDGHNCTILGGGAFELYLHQKLNALAGCSEESLASACRILAKSVLCVPLNILRNSFHPSAKEINLFSLLKQSKTFSSDKIVWVNGRSGLIMNSTTCTNVKESLVGKVDLVYHLLELVIQLLRTDQLVPVTNAHNQTSLKIDEDE